MNAELAYLRTVADNGRVPETTALVALRDQLTSWEADNHGDAVSLLTTAVAALLEARRCFDAVDPHAVYWVDTFRELVGHAEMCATRE